MSYETSVKHEWADEARTVVKRTTIDYPADLVELQTALDQAVARLLELPMPEPYPDQVGYMARWSDTGLSFEDVCRVIDQRNQDNPDVQERLRLEAMIVQVEADIIDWRSKAKAARA